MRFWGRIKDHPLVSFVAGGVSLLLVIGGLWTFVSADPPVQSVLDWLRRAGDTVLTMAVVVAWVAVIGWMVFVQFKMFMILNDRQVVDDPIAGLSEVDGKLVAGTDFSVDLTVPGAETSRAVSFSARQGKRVIVRDKSGTVDAANGRYRLPLSAKETRSLKDGYLLVQATIVTQDGIRATLDPVSVRTVGRIVS